ncbi:MAG: hypothetical protein ACOYID_08510 [Eubacteriales bacterium]|nr:hypothetical protein [Clostridiales bacterium]
MSNEEIKREIKKIAPSLQPDVLRRAAEGLARHEIDISNLVKLAECLENKEIVTTLEETDYERLSGDVLEMFLPFLSPESMYKVFEKIIEGELDYQFLAVMLPYSEYLIEHVECAVVYGVLDEGALEIIRKYQEQKDALRAAEK